MLEPESIRYPRPTRRLRMVVSRLNIEGVRSNACLSFSLSVIGTSSARFRCAGFSDHAAWLRWGASRLLRVSVRRHFQFDLGDFLERCQGPHLRRQLTSHSSRSITLPKPSVISLST